MGRIFGSACTTGPPMKVGEVLLNAVCFGYKATASHMWPSLTQQSGWFSGTCLRSASATRWYLSQYCTAVGSETRDKVRLVGVCQSVGRIGSHTMNTRTSFDGSCFSKSSSAEAPRKQVGQVGESRVSTRTFSAASSKLFANWLKLLSVSSSMGGCPCGTRRLPKTCQPRAAATTMADRPTTMTWLLFTAPTERGRSRLLAGKR